MPALSEALRKRILTAVALGAGALVIVLALPPLATVAGASLLALGGAWEWSAFLRPAGRPGRAAYVALVAALLVLALRVAAVPGGEAAILAAAVAWWLLALAWVAFAPHRVARWSAAAAGILALVPAWLALVRLRAAGPTGAQWVVFLLCLVYFADIGAYFGGRRFGRLRLAPEVSPGKTWEGAVAGVAASAAVAVAGGLWFRIPLGTFLPLCLAAVAISIVGDLTESLVKRYAGLKDSGSLLPGHGGIMDRIDSLTGAAPVLLFGLTLLGVIA